ncbi:MAG: low molecular weight phosphatase family protein [Terriglobia bacterium]
MASGADAGARLQADSAPRPVAQPRKRVAFVCFGNSCRSQMAEAWARHLGRDRVEAMSAGLHPLGSIAPETTQVMEEKGIRLEGQKSKGLEEIDWRQVDVLVNMLPIPGRSLLPSFEGQLVVWKVRDPYQEPVWVHRKVRDQLRRLVERLLDDLKGSAL